MPPALRLRRAASQAQVCCSLQPPCDPAKHRYALMLGSCHPLMCLPAGRPSSTSPVMWQMPLLVRAAVGGSSWGGLVGTPPRVEQTSTRMHAQLITQTHTRLYRAADERSAKAQPAAAAAAAAAAACHLAAGCP